MAYKLNINTEKEPSIFDSKIGGLPYWDFEADENFPLDSDGKELQLLAQINFEDESLEIAKNDERLPKNGILQFFISKNDLLGLNLEEPTEQKDFRVIYHKSINKNVTEEQVKSHNISIADEDNDEYSPILKEGAIYFSEADDESEFESGIFVKESFTQDDPRCVIDEESEKVSESNSFENMKRYNTTLFQLDSNTNYDYIMWGDSGIGQFFINDEKLKNLDFSDIWYNWDCC